MNDATLSDVQDNIPKDWRKKLPLRNRLGIFFICVLISAVMWFFIQLTKDYTWELNYKIDFTNIPDGLALVHKSDTLMTVSVTAQGFDLLMERFISRHQVLSIDLSDVRFRQGNEKYTAYLTSQRIRDLVSNQLNFQKTIVFIHPDTIYFRFSEISKKRIPVRLNVHYTLAKQFYLYDSILVSPKFINVSSIQSVLDTLQYIESQPVEFKGLDTTRTYAVPLRKTISEKLISYSPDTVSVTIPVQKYVEAKFLLDVRLGNDSTSSHLNPDKVELTCLVPQKELSKIDESQFVVQAIKLSSNSGKSTQMKVNVAKMPPHVYLVSVKPENVEYTPGKK